MANELQFGSPFAPRQRSLNRRRDLLDVMAMRTLQPLQGRMVGNQYVAPSPMDALGQVLSAYVIGKRQKALDAEGAKLAQDYQQGLTKQISDYLSAHGGGADAERMAAVGAMASPFGPLQQIGMHDYKNLGPKLRTVDGVVFDEKTGEITQLKGAQPSLTRIGGDLFQISPSTGAFKKLDNAPSVTVNTKTSPIFKGESSFMKKLGETTAEAITTAQADKVSAQKVMATITKLEEMNKLDTFAGPAAEVSTAIAAFADSVGFPVDRGKLTNSEAYKAELNKQIAQYLTAGSGVGRSMTNEDRKKIESQFPQLVNSVEGRNEIVRIMKDAANRQTKHADAVFANAKKQFPEAARLLDVMPATQAFPQPIRGQINKPGSSRQNPISLQDYLKGKR